MTVHGTVVPAPHHRCVQVYYLLVVAPQSAPTPCASSGVYERSAGLPSPRPAPHGNDNDTGEDTMALDVLEVPQRGKQLVPGPRWSSRFRLVNVFCCLGLHAIVKARSLIVICQSYNCLLVLAIYDLIMMQGSGRVRCQRLT